tara:strand:+ start:120 stop:377 length:258 start_codon:yes stop_codon:yes gene_type:complete
MSELTTEEVAEHHIKRGLMQVREHPDYQPETETYNNMIRISREVGMLEYVLESYTYYIEMGRRKELAAFLALAEWDLAIIPSYEL